MTSLFGLDCRHVDGPLFAHHQSRLSCMRPATPALCPSTPCHFFKFIFWSTATPRTDDRYIIPSHMTFETRRSIYPILYHDTLLTSCRVLAPSTSSEHLRLDCSPSLVEVCVGRPWFPLSSL